MGTMVLLVLVILFGPSAGNRTYAGALDSPGAYKSLVCTACHGDGGNSPGDTVPVIAGLAPAYFKKAIKDYAEGRRASPEMEPYAKYVMQAGLDEVAGYFAEQKRQPRRVKADAQALKRGAAAAVQCAACHNAEAERDAEKAVPSLRGQPPGYLSVQMLLLKDDKRKLEDTALDETKKRMLKSLSDRDVADLAAYFASLK
ncbi:MAG TPA: c-type cytochrome [Candidatus Eisenbacteria bacterium]|nr:c-type cytochrome [Candidatus Eisenbacteria bacterium]